MCPFPDWLSPSHSPTGNTISTCPQRDAPPSPKLASLLFPLLKDQCQPPTAKKCGLGGNPQGLLAVPVSGGGILGIFYFILY